MACDELMLDLFAPGPPFLGALAVPCGRGLAENRHAAPAQLSPHPARVMKDHLDDCKQRVCRASCSAPKF